jgi:hypothetical protein
MGNTRYVPRAPRRVLRHLFLLLLVGGMLAGPASTLAQAKGGDGNYGYQGSEDDPSGSSHGNADLASPNM